MGVLARFVNLFEPGPTGCWTGSRIPAIRSTCPTSSSWQPAAGPAGRRRRGHGPQAPRNAGGAARAQAAKLQLQAKQALAIDREDLAREALPAGRHRRPARRARAAARADRHPGAPAGPRRASSSSPTWSVPRPARRPEGELFGRRGADPRRGGGRRHFGDAQPTPGWPCERAQDKIASMQARAGAIDELLASGALTDLGSSTDDIQARLQQGRRPPARSTPSSAALEAGASGSPPPPTGPRRAGSRRRQGPAAAKAPSGVDLRQPTQRHQPEVKSPDGDHSPNPRRPRADGPHVHDRPASRRALRGGRRRPLCSRSSGASD